MRPSRLHLTESSIPISMLGSTMQWELRRPQLRRQCPPPMPCRNAWSELERLRLPWCKCMADHNTGPMPGSKLELLQLGQCPPSSSNGITPNHTMCNTGDGTTAVVSGGQTTTSGTMPATSCTPPVMHGGPTIGGTTPATSGGPTPGEPEPAMHGGRTTGNTEPPMIQTVGMLPAVLWMTPAGSPVEAAIVRAVS